MCKKKLSTDVIEPTNSRRPSQSLSRKNFGDPPTSNSNITTMTSANYTTTGGSSYNNYKDSWQSSSVSSRTSLSSIRESLPETAQIYDFSEICSATNNFLSKKLSSSSSSWRCSLRGNDVVISQRKLRRLIHAEELREKLSLIYKSHHTSLIKLRGASLSGNYIYLVYDYIHGVSLSECLRNPRNPGFTVLSNWMSRIQIATDLAHGLDYVHHFTGLSSSFVHNRIKSSGIIVAEPSLNAKICHVGMAELCGEIVKEEEEATKSSNSSGLKRSGSRSMKFEGTRGYMSPEFQSTGVSSQKSDVFAFGVVVLELLSGREPLKYEIDEEGGGYKRVSVIETAREAVGGDGDGRLRRWVDRRLKDSYPVEVMEKMVRVGLECVEEDPDKRPDMGRVAGRISKLYLDSKSWAEKLGVPTDFSVSLAPR